MLLKKMLPLATWVLLLGAVVILYKPDLLIRKNAAGVLPKQRAQVIPVVFGKVSQSELESQLAATGSLLPLETLLVFPKVEARVKKVFFEIGAEVFPGNCLAESDDTDFRLGIQEAKMALKLDLSRLGMDEIPKTEGEFNKLPTLVRASLLEKNALTKLERLRRLGGSASNEDRDQADTEAKVARANFENTLLEAKTALAGVRFREAQLAIAEQRLRDSKIIVPEINEPGGMDFKPFLNPTVAKLSFILQSRNVNEGELFRTNNSEPVFKLAIDRLLKLQVSLQERDYSKIAKGMRAELLVAPYPGKVFNGTIARINPTIDMATRTFLVEIAVPNEQKTLRPGFFANVKINTGRKAKALLVPQEAVFNYAGSNKVFVLAEGKAKPVEVKTGQNIILTNVHLENLVEIIGDLKPGDIVALTGQQYLADGTQVREKTPNNPVPSPMGEKAP